MNEYRIFCQFTPAPAALERILRTTRVRGFTIGKLEATVSESGMNLEMNVQGNRDICNLLKQLDKLQEVSETGQRQGVPHKKTA